VLAAVSAALLVLGPSALAFGQDDEPGTGSSTGSGGNADDLVAQGIALRRSGQDAQALAVFQRAEALEPDSARIQVHLAAAHQALGEWEAADRYLTRALAQSNDAYVQRHQSMLASARRRIDAHIGSLEVSGGPAGTQVWLNGRLVGKLPMSETVRIEGGIYTLEARLPRHYPVTRSVAIAGGSLVRESLRLQPVSSAGSESSPAVSAGEQSVEVDAGTSPSGTPGWLTWTLAGLTVGAAAGTAYAWTVREGHAEKWNDDDECLDAGRTREQVCSSEFDAGKSAETWMWIGGATTGAFAAATLVSLWLQRDEEAGDPSTAGLDCGFGWNQVLCSGRF
jgi:tetratricopeptide (TPR) repeat protein